MQWAFHRSSFMQMPVPFDFLTDPMEPLSTFVNTAPLGINGQAEQALQEWPYQEDSIFEFVRRKQLSNDSFRPHDLQDEKNRATTKFFMPFDSIRRAIDAYCITFPVVGSAWCMIVYLRCLPSAPFAEHHINLLRQFKPAMARVTQGGYHREFHGRTAPADRHRSATARENRQQYKNR